LGGEQDVGFGDLEGHGEAVCCVFEDLEEGGEEGEELGGCRGGGLDHD